MPILHYVRKLLASTSIIVALASAAGVSYHTGAHADGQPPAQQATPVIVQTIKEEAIRLWSDFSGRLRPVNYAEIHPEVSGQITEVRFVDGQTVKQGDVLFVIDPRPYAAALERANARLATTLTNAKFTQLEFDRAQQLIKTEAIAQRSYDERANSNDVAQADIKAAQAEVSQAQINLDRAFVKAPFDGRLSRAEVTLGNLVQAGQGSPLLTSIVSNDGIYADFDVDENTYYQSIHNTATTHDLEQKIPVELSVSGDAKTVYKGTIDSFDNHVNPTSGTIRARAKFANKEGALVPGMFVAIRLGSAEQKLILAPNEAISTDQDKKFVYVVGKGNKVIYREVKLGATVAGKRVVSSGLQAGDRVIVDGLQHVHPDSVVDAKEAGAK